MDDTTWKAGLEDVIAARSAITAVDGGAGRLYYRGYEIADVVERLAFEEATALLWFGEAPDPDAAAAFRARLAATRGLPAEVFAALRTLPRDCHPLDALRTGISAAAAHDPDARASDRDANLRKACRLMTLVPETVGAWHRIRTGREPVPARTDLGHAAYVLSLLEGREPTPDVARVLDVVLTLHADHELNASTFAARVAVATLADLHAAIVAAIATLKGPRHGGANDDVLAMLREIEDPARAEAFVADRLDVRAGLSRAERADPRARMPGFGHRVYRVDDARARVLRGLAQSMAAATGRERLFEVAERVYAAVKARTGLPVNVDFFSAVVYDALGIAPDLCTSIFAIGRVAGWCAHALEQYADNRLIRPRADYVGSPPRTFAVTV
ncbi:MAG: citrate synthase [Candidatus Rokubacteria bacterium]|nr:citrate synthase [Candidatus Rokubacteria bacterium]